MTSLTAPCRVPPSEVKSFWYSMSTTAVRVGSMLGVSDIVVSNRRDDRRRVAGGRDFDGSPGRGDPTSRSMWVDVSRSSGPAPARSTTPPTARADELVDSGPMSHNWGGFIRAGVVDPRDKRERRERAEGQGRAWA